MYRFYPVVLAMFIFSAMAFSQEADWAISANSVENLQGDLNSVSPTIHTPSNAEFYLDDASALGYDGPLGPYGPLGSLGPVGDNVWNVSYWLELLGDWSEWSETNVNGPLSEEGPLGPFGPLSELAYDVDLPAINDFSKQLQAGGVWTALGPIGPLGALGPLGPLGPIGAHGYISDADGRYLNTQGQEVRDVAVDYDEDIRFYSLYENYEESYAQAKTDNDTSFMVEGYIAWPYGETDAFEFTASDDTHITVVLSPIYALDDFDLTIRDQDGNVVAQSNTYSYVDFIQLNNIAPNTVLTAEVTLYSSYHALSKDYRLFVTGSTAQINTTLPITGNHQILR